MQGTYEYFPFELVFGTSADVAIRDELNRMGAQRAFVLSSRHLSRQTGPMGAPSRLDQRPAGRGLHGGGGTPHAAPRRAAAMASELRPDVLISIGGGSAIDLAKMVQIALAEDIRKHEDLDGLHLRRDEAGGMVTPSIRTSGLRPIAYRRCCPALSSPTRQEATTSADLYVRRDLAPVAVVLDPALSLHTPDWLWLSTAVRSMDNAIESICSLTAQLITDANCAHGLAMLQRSLRPTRQDPSDLDARLESQIGVWLATAGLARGHHGASHGIGYALGAIGGVPHGHCSCVMLPAAAFQQSGHRRAAEPRFGSPRRTGSGRIRSFLRLLHAVGVPPTLRDVGIAREQFD